MKILLANDDGIEAYGLRALARALSPEHEITVAAPAEEQSAKSHAITFGREGLSFESYAFGDGIAAYKIFGTPADCVKFACIHFGVRPNLVIAGINHGHNLGSEILYSGTVSAAFEGAYLGIPAIAVSCATKDDCALFDAAAQFVTAHLREFVSLPTEPFSVLNVNYPQHVAVGHVYTRMGVQLFHDIYQNEEEHYYLRGYPIGYEKNEEDCDVNWILKDYVTISPLQSDRTDYRLLARIREQG